MELQVFASDPFKVFGELIGQQLNVRVRYKGREIKASMGPPPTIWLPNIEGAKKETVEIMFGLCLHEAGHLRFSNFNIIADIKDYLTKSLHNMLEDEYMERYLERDFPGARGMLCYSMTHLHQMIIAGKPIELPDLSKPFIKIDPLCSCEQRYSLSDDVKAQVETFMNKKIDEAMDIKGLDPANGEARDQFIKDAKFDPKMNEKYLLVAKRMELERVMRLWFITTRGYDLPTHDWNDHPWKEVFDKHTLIKARNTKSCLEKAIVIIEELGLTPVLPTDDRPVELAKELLDTAEERASEAKDARGKVTELSRKIKKQIEEASDACPLQDNLTEAEDEEGDARDESKQASASVRRAKDRLRQARASEKETRQQLAAERKRIRELQKELKNADGEEKERIQKALEKVEERAKTRDELLTRKQQETEALKTEVDQKMETSSAKRAALLEKTGKKLEAKRYLDEALDSIRKSIEEEHANEKRRLTDAADRADAAAEEAVENANEVLNQIKTQDSIVEAQVAPGAVEYVLGETFEENRDEPLNEEMGDAPDCVQEPDTNKTGKTGVLYIGNMTRKYVPYCRDYDEVHRIGETSEGLDLYEASRKKYEGIIAETTDKLRQLYSPELCRQVFNREEGRLDPRWAYKIGMALRGADVDISAIRKNVEPLPDPKVAVSLIVDCSGSLDTNVAANGETYLQLSQAAACCLSEVMTNLSIPHEVLGHTTAPERFDGEGMEELEHFSRFIPFQGYVFRDFDDENAAKAIYTKIPHYDNLDGEALLWGIQRLAERQEKTKLCIVLSDGLPESAWSSPTELQRHLYTVCKNVEAQEENNLYLFGLGIGSDVVKHFYKNHSSINNIDELPKSVLGIVEKVLIEMVGTLG